MENIEIFNKLKALGIENISQLEKGNIQYWWNKKYKQIIASNIKLKTNPLSDEIIKINLFKEELQELEIEDLKSILEEGKHNQIWQKNYTEIEKTDLENDEKLRRDKKNSNLFVEVKRNQTKETFKYEHKNITSQSNKKFLNFKKSIQDIFVIFIVIITFLIGNEIAKNNSFINVNKTVAKWIKKNRNDLLIDLQVDRYVVRMKPKNENIITIEPDKSDEGNNKFERIRQLNEKFNRKDNKYLKTFLDGSQEMNFYLNRALNNERLGKYKEAIEDYDLVMKIKISESDSYYKKSLHHTALYNRAWLKIKNKIKDYKGAIEDMEKLIIINPNNINLKIDLATFYSYDNKNRKAVQILDEAIKEKPYEGNLYYWKGVYQNLFSYPSGCRYIRKSKKLKASDWYPGFGNC